MNRYEFALLRYVHDPVGGEFANVGVAMLDPDARRLLFITTDRYRRFSEFFRDVDGAAYRAIVRSIERSLREVDSRLKQGDLVNPVPARLAQILETILPQDGCAIQVSRVMGGMHEDPEERLRELFAEFVGRYEELAERAKRTEDVVRRDFDERIVKAGLFDRVQFGYQIQAANYRYSFHTAWQNGRPQVLEPISFDLEQGRSIVEKAVDWSGRLLNLSHGPEFRFTGLIAPPSDPTLTSAFNQALAILWDAPAVRDVVLERDAATILQTIRDDTERHPESVH